MTPRRDCPPSNVSAGVLGTKRNYDFGARTGHKAADGYSQYLNAEMGSRGVDVVRPFGRHRRRKSRSLSRSVATIGRSDGSRSSRRPMRWCSGVLAPAHRQPGRDRRTDRPRGRRPRGRLGRRARHRRARRAARREGRRRRARSRVRAPPPTSTSTTCCGRRAGGRRRGPPRLRLPVREPGGSPGRAPQHGVTLRRAVARRCWPSSATRPAPASSPRRPGFPVLAATDPDGAAGAAGAHRRGDGQGGRRRRRARDAAGDRPDALADALARCASEARRGVRRRPRLRRGAARPARHVEVQMLGDGTGAVTQLGERDCSVQRRHQKIVEVAPAPGLARTCAPGCSRRRCGWARPSRYARPGHRRVPRQPAERFAFIEVNPRLQVEHTVTEEVTGVDLVADADPARGRGDLAELGLTQDGAPAPARHGPAGADHERAHRARRRRHTRRRDPHRVRAARPGAASASTAPGTPATGRA